MNIFDSIANKFNKHKTRTFAATDGDEFCPRCDANLTLQKGYSNELPVWNCKGCGELLINPALDTEDDIIWFCDECEDILNLQEGFADHDEKWTCKKCGFINKIDVSELYLSDEDYQASKQDPYKGLTDEQVLELSCYEDVQQINGRGDIILVRDCENNKLYVKKLLKDYDISVYQYLKEHAVANMPRLIDLFESSNCLVVMEEYIEGRTLSDILEKEVMTPAQAICIVEGLCKIIRMYES